MKAFTFILFFFCIISLNISAEPLITNSEGRSTTNLNGKWRYIIDPYETGLYSYRLQARSDGYFLNQKPKDKSELIEYDFDNSGIINVPGDWNTQDDKLFLYEGTIWYKKSFNFRKVPGRRTFIYFGAVNYTAAVYINGKKAGEHEGGFTSFNFEVTDLLIDGDNFVVVKADNKRRTDAVPTTNTDWWNYGGITRDVRLIDVPESFIEDYSIQLKKGSLKEIEGWIKLNGKDKKQNVRVEIPEAGINRSFTTDENGFVKISFNADLKLWSPEDPYSYNVKITSGTDMVNEAIAFRLVETKGNEILLNGKPVFLRGISIHEEAPIRTGRAYSKEDAQMILQRAKDLGCNFVRLAHYPHNEYMAKEADRMGIMIWAEIPVYWTILWDNAETYKNASNQLKEMITRDKNRASVIIWSVANETPRGDQRLKFLRGLIDSARQLDPTRLITAATEIHTENKTIIMSDPLSEYLDVIGVNEYVGWYSGKPEDAPGLSWKSEYKKPLIISEFGGDALFGLHGDKHERWTEEYQADLYLNQLEMLKNIPFLRGMTPWILSDFRSPKRVLPAIQDFFNRKGLISEKGDKKQAYYILQKFYDEMKKKGKEI
ncbi:MAG: glycoside hydrolase family 2 protein [Bacillota bacterium]